MDHWEEEIGTIEHYYNHAHIAGIHIEHGRLHVGDRLHFIGHTTDFEEVITSMQVNHQDVREVGRGAHVGVPVHDRVREHDKVFLIH